jgi:poly(3-hydroxybutyrate) depolymerase
VDDGSLGTSSDGGVAVETSGAAQDAGTTDRALPSADGSDLGIADRAGPVVTDGAVPAIKDAAAPAPDSGPQPRSSGCGGDAGSAGLNTVVQNSIVVQAKHRTYRLYVPPTYASTTPVPLVFGYHGKGADGSAPWFWGVQDQAAMDGETAIFIFPDGQPQYGSSVDGVVQPDGTIGWDESPSGNDVAMFDGLLGFAQSAYCIDPSRVFVTGFSWGAEFSNALGCLRGDRIPAIDTFSSGFRGSGCTSAAPAFRTSYSTPDGSDPNFSQADFEGAIAHYRALLGCGATTQPVSPSPCLGYEGCSAPLVFCAYPNLGHALPPSGGADAWEFFASLR